MAEGGDGSAGGSANEGGSVYRSAFGAYLIAYGLADLKVPLQVPSPGVPAWLWFESDSPVDDLSVQFSSGARWDIQATAKCSWNAKFRDTTDQWVRAVRSDRLQPNDRVVLAAANLSQPLRDLREAFRRVQDGGTLTPREAEAIERFRKDAQDAGWLDVFDHVTQVALVVELDCATDLDPGYREAAVLLEASAVRTGSGFSAMAALRDFVHTEAARKGSSRSDRWVDVLTAASLEIGPSAPSTLRVNAVRMAEYRQSLSENLDRLPLHFLGIAAEPLVVEDLLDRFNVELPETDSYGRTRSSALADIARRWAGLCVIGAAGTGKSTAVRQLAAAWAADADAPVPVLVPMHRLVGPLRDGELLPLAKVVELGLGVDAYLTPLLEERLLSGRAALILDGLDECRDQQDSAVELVRQLDRHLPASAGLIVSARDASISKATATGLPVTRLTEPRHLAAVAEDILELVVSTTRPDCSPEDVAQARSWMAISQSDHPDMWKVPLFSALLAAHAGRTPASSLPSSRADALVAAIKDSVGSWETIKQAEPAAWQADLTPAQLIDGFSAMGHATAGGSASRPQVIAEVVEVLSARWNLVSAPAHEKAEEILAWWIGRVGAFTDLREQVRPSLRLFGEVADAMWASGQPDEVASAWMAAALADASQYREPILLAVSLSPTMLSALMDHAIAPNTALLAAEAISIGNEPTDEELTILAQRLFEVAEPTAPAEDVGALDLFATLSRSQAEYDGATWPFKLALARLPQRGAVSTFQARAVEAEVDPERHLVLVATIAVTSCRLEGRPPNDVEASVLTRLLDLPAPPRDQPPSQVSRRRIVMSSSPPVLTGRLDATIGAIDLVGLDDDQAESAVVMSGRSSAIAADKMFKAIRNAGYAALLAEKGPMSHMAAAMKSLAATEDDYQRVSFILDEAHAAAHYRAAEPSWRLEAVAALLELLAIEDAPIGHVGWAISKRPHLVAKLVELALRSDALDVPQVAAQAANVANIVREKPLASLVLLLGPADPRRRSEPVWPDASKADVDWLRECAYSPSTWLAILGVTLISSMTDPDGDDLLLAEICSITPSLRKSVAVALLSDTESDELRTKWLTHPDQLVQAAAAQVLGGRPLDLALLHSLVSHPDLTVRLAALHGVDKLDGSTFERVAEIALEPPPTVWTCTDCGEQQSMKVRDCGSCSRGSRSEVAEEIERLRKSRAKVETP